MDWLELFNKYGPVPLYLFAIWFLYKSNEAIRLKNEERAADERREYIDLLKQTLVALTRFNDAMDAQDDTSTQK